MSELPIGTVTFLFSDVEGSTRLDSDGTLVERFEGAIVASHIRVLA